MKDDHSLDELAGRLSDSSSYEKVTVTTEEMIERNIVISRQGNGMQRNNECEGKLACR